MAGQGQQQMTQAELNIEHYGTRAALKTTGLAQKSCWGGEQTYMHFRVLA
jgi:hypothetical protein